MAAEPPAAQGRRAWSDDDWITCPRCEGQKYDRGSCGLCGNLGVLDKNGERFHCDCRADDWVEGDTEIRDVYATQFYGGASIYCLTPASEEAARAVATHAKPTPVQSWELPRGDSPGVVRKYLVTLIGLSEKEALKLL